MEYIREWIFNPMLSIISYPITLFGFTFNILSIIIFTFLLGVLVAIIRFFIGGKD